MSATVITQCYYISSGKLNAMYTLRCNRSAPGMAAFVCPDFYICNLAATRELAVEKATQYVNQMRERIGENESFKIVFDEYADFNINHRRGKLSARETAHLEMIEAGIFPFGKYRGESIQDAADSYILWMTDRTKEADLEPVFAVLAGACAGIAAERGLLAKREAIRAERQEQDEKSTFIGEVGQRVDLRGELFMVFLKQSEMGDFYINKLRVGNDIVTYVGGKPLGEKGATISIRATIKKHETYNGVNSTVVNRPMVI